MLDRKSASHCEFKESVGCVERRLAGCCNVAVLHLTTSKDLYISALEIDVHQHGDQVLSQSVDMIQVRNMTLETALSCVFHGQQRGNGCGFQGTQARVGAG